MKKGNIFWGVLLVIIGVLFALRSLDIFYFSWHSIFRLWPLIFIFWGISILPVKSAIKLILTFITIVIAIVILASYPGKDYYWFNWWPERYHHREYKENFDEEQHLSERYDSTVNHATLNLDAVAGKFYIKNKTSKLYEFDCKGENSPYEASATINDQSATLNIKHAGGIRHADNLVTDAWLALNPGPLWILDISAGAATLEIDVTPFKVEKIDLEGGASKISLKLGDMYNQTNVSVDAGASAIELLIPKSSACEIRASSILLAKDIEGFTKIESGLYRTPDFSDASNKIYVEIDAAVSSLKVQRF